MQAEFGKAVAALKGTKKGGKKALYALPWYAIIGPPGCGKSTALRNSGLQFPYLSASGGGVRGLGGTRNCDWWMTSDAVILDTAGRWTSEDEDHEEWLGFLDLIKRFRPKKPLNGLITAVSIGDIGGCREDDVSALARRVRERIDEVQQRLQMSMPVYVLFTKCDLIPGFVETFGDMSKQDRGQVWGFTAPLTKPIGTPGEYFAKGFEELSVMVGRRAMKRMGEERKIASRELIYGFPQQLDVMKQNLQEFVHQLFLENVFKETPRIRGVYFTSGTQEGRPIDRVMSAMAEAFGQPQVQLPSPQVESKSYFLRDMFMNVLFKDKDAAVRSPEQIRKQRRTTYLTAAAIFSLALGISGLPALAWAMNRSHLNDTREVVDGARASTSLASEGPRGVLSADAIEPLRTRVIELQDYEDDGPPLMMQMGMYQDDVFPNVRRVYLTAMHDRVVGPLLAADVREMLTFAEQAAALGAGAPPDAETTRNMYDALKLHLLLTRPRAEFEPPLDDDLCDFMITQLHRRWTAATGTRRHEPQYRQMRENIEYFVHELQASEAGETEGVRTLSYPRNDGAIAAVRGVFSSADPNALAVQGIIAEIQPLNYDVRLSSLVGRDVNALQSSDVVRGAFTKRAWDERVEDMLDNDAARFFGQDWVFGHEPPESQREADRILADRIAALRGYFLMQYVAEWRRFIDSIYTVVPQDQQGHMLQLTDYVSGNPHLITRLIRLIDSNVTLAQASTDMSASALQRRAEQMARQRAASRLGRVGGIGRQNAANLLGVAEDRVEDELADGSGEVGPGTITAWNLRNQFRGLIDFAPAQDDDVPAGTTRQTTRASIYEEQLEYLRDALGSTMQGTPIQDFQVRQRTARTITEGLIADSDDDWRWRLRTLLMPPIEGTAWVPIPAPAPLVPTAAGGSAAATPAAPAAPTVAPGEPPPAVPTPAPAAAAVPAE